MAKPKIKKGWEINPYNTVDDDIFLLEELLKEDMYERSEQNLYQFFINFWNTFDPQPLVNNWHLECLCEHIQAALDRKIRRLAINIPPRCLPGSVQINMADGSYKSIKDIAIGEFVLSSDTKELHSNKVIDVIKAGKLPCVEITFSDGNKLEASTQHKIYTVNRGWVKASELDDNDVVMSSKICTQSDYVSPQVKQVKYIGEKNCFDLTVENDHTFFAENILTHNSSKSTTASICAPVWHWINHPHEKFWLISHSARLFMQNIVYARNILNHPLYKERWLDIMNSENFKYQLSKDSNTKTRIDNTAGGYILGGSPTSGMLGMGYTVAVLDDILDSEESQNIISVQAVNEWYTNTFLNRSNDVQNDVQIIVMQRLHQKDLTAYVQETYPEQDWFVLNLPAKYEPTRTFVSPIGYNDKRTVRNQLLDPVRLTEEFLITQSKKKIIYNTRYQQDPDAGQDGNLIKEEWLQETHIKPINYSVMLTVWDLSITESPESDYTVGLVVCKAQDNFYIIDMWRKQCEIPTQIDAIKRMRKKYPKSIVGVESKVTGHAAMSLLKRDIPDIYALEPRKFGGNKEQRLGATLPYFRDKKVFIYNPFEEDKKLESTYDPNAIIKELKGFPLGSNDDIVDCVAYAINYLAEYGNENTAIITGGERLKIFEEDYILEQITERSSKSIYAHDEYDFDSNYIPTRSDLNDIAW